MLKNKAGFRKTSFLIYGLTPNHRRYDAQANGRGVVPALQEMPAPKHEPREAAGFAGLEQSGTGAIGCQLILLLS